MCTSITYKHYFGRTLDVPFSFGEEIVITPRYYPFSFKEIHCLKTHYAMIGVAKIIEDYPLYYDATNEKGLSMAGLNFPEAIIKIIKVLKIILHHLNLFHGYWDNVVV